MRELQAGTHQVDRQLDAPTIRLLENGVFLDAACPLLHSDAKDSEGEACACNAFVSIFVTAEGS